MNVIRSTELNDRFDFADLCNAHGITEAMEVGVDQAHFARKFMERFDGDMLYLIDPYLPYEDIPGPRTASLMVAVLAMQPHLGRFRFFMLSSSEAARQLPGAVQPRFIFLDAAKDFGSVRSDIDAWWRRLPEDGILAGADYREPVPGVVEAVNEFAARDGVTVRIAPADGSWYAYKTEAMSRRE